MVERCGLHREEAACAGPLFPGIVVTIRRKWRILMKLKYLIPAVLALWLFPVTSAHAPASHGLKQVLRASQTMESGVERCAAKLEGKAFIACVANELNKYSGRLSVKGAEQVAPQGAPNATAAATGVRAAPTPAAAASVLNRVASIVGSLATSSERDTRRAYTRINQAFSRAATILASKGG